MTTIDLHIRIDSVVAQDLRNSGVNVSLLCRDLLGEYAKNNSGKLASAKKSMVKSINSEKQIQVRVKKLRKLFKYRFESKAIKDAYRRGIDSLCKDFNLDRSEVIKKVFK